MLIAALFSFSFINLPFIISFYQFANNIHSSAFKYINY